MIIGKIAELGDLYVEVNDEGTSISVRDAEVVYKAVLIGDQPRREVYMNYESKDYMVVLEFVGGEDGNVEVRVHELLEQAGRVGINNTAYKILPMGAPAPEAITNQTVSPAPPVAAPVDVHALMGAAPVAMPAPPTAPVVYAPVPPARLATKAELREQELESKYDITIRSFAKHVSLEQAKELVKTSITEDKPFMEDVVNFKEDMIEVDPDKVDRMTRIIRTLPASTASIFDPEDVARHILRAWEG